jgi:hypothetical protein
LVFPTLFPTGAPERGRLPHSISLYYDFTGAIDNIYASLVSKLMVSEEFGIGRLEAGRVEFDRPRKGLCGIRQTRREGGFAHLDLFFDESTSKEVRHLFTGFVEQHLRENGVDIREHQAIKCQCGKIIEEEDVAANISAGRQDVICPRCRRATQISDGVDRIRGQDQEAGQRILALRKRIEERTAVDVALAKGAVAGKRALALWMERRQLLDRKELAASDAATRSGIRKDIEECEVRIAQLIDAAGRNDDRSAGEPIRILQLSDLHFDGQTEPRARLQWLVDDLERSMKVERLEYLVVCGDVTDKGNEEGFEKGREFVESLIEHFGLSAQRCVLVPGKHDIDDLLCAYARRRTSDGVPSDHVVQQGDIVLTRDATEYPKRLLRFSDAFYHKIIQLPYPLDVDCQGQAWLFEDTRVQFLAFNSAWEIDEFHRKRSGIAPTAVAHAIDAADQQVKAAVNRGDLTAEDKILRIGVWHHAVAGPEMMANIDFIGNLQKCGVKLCLHGDVHEMRVDLIGYKTGLGMQVIGAGSFATSGAGRPESTPRLYNVLEVQRDHATIRIHTREQRRSDGPWQGWHQWPDPDNPDGRLAYFELDVPRD